ncbi:MAG TPA: ATP-dependent DNA helicase RecG [Dehalococcoidia bacterium]
MSQEVERLRRILREEARQGYADRVVLGGLDRLLANLAARGAFPAGSPLRTVLDALPAGGYAALPPEGRREWVRQAAAALAGRTPAPAAAPPAASAAPKRRTAPAAPQAPARPRVRRSQPLPPGGLEAPVTALKGVRESTAAKFRRLGVQTVRDLLYLFPHRYNDFSQVRTVAELEPGRDQTAVVTVWQATESQFGPRIKGTEAVVGDETGTMRAVWFNQPYLARQIREGQRLVLSGRVGAFRGVKVFESPEWEPLDSGDLSQAVHTGRLVPVYPLTQGLYARTVRRAVRQALDAWADHLPDPLPEALRAELGVPPLVAAVHQMHYPDDLEAAEAARRRLALDEFLTLQLAVLSRRRTEEAGLRTAPIPMPAGTLDAFTASLPFSLTAAQRRALAEVLADMAREVPMSRLLQGDVGSGKTVVATAALLAAVANGFQGVIMAPTEILAEQHFRTVTRLLSGDADPPDDGLCPVPYLERPVRVALLTGSLSQREKDEVQYGLAAGDVDIAVGTHALIQEGVRFPRLGLAVVDEQHRFGVLQRAALREKGGSPHLLVMTATPIPRTLALTLYGDLDISVIDEMPEGRQPVVTRWVPVHQRGHAYQFVRDQIAEGRQAFIICPLVEESEALQARAAVQEFERLQREEFPPDRYRMAVLHGRMGAKQKDEVMRAFRDGALDILVSTAVVEVGIDVPNATVMVIEGADRFGLAQLHQFRGRVGRGRHRSYCLLLSDNPSDEAQERLRIMETTADGFALAEHDLRLRGPGEYFGVRQSGMPDLRVARISDTPILEQARELARRILAADPALARPEHAELAAAARRLLESGPAEAH